MSSIGDDFFSFFWHRICFLKVERHIIPAGVGMNRFLFRLIAAVLAIVSLLFPLFAQEQPKIRERVEVVNLEVLVRVLDKEGVPVAGLKREDFRISEGRVPVEINGFSEIRKKISVAGPVHRRLFALFFNVGNPRSDLERAVDMFFETIFKPGDRLMVMTNRFSIADHVVSDPARERETIRGILLGETKNFQYRLVQLEQKLKMLIYGLKTIWESEEIEEEITKALSPRGTKLYLMIKRFYAQYLQYFDEYLEGYLTLTLEQYARMAEYLKNQEVEKYALVFYQQGIFPHIPEQGQVELIIDRIMKGRILPSMQINQIQADIQTRLLAPKGPSETDIARLFLNSGVTFHTLLLLPSIRRDVEDLEYQPVATGPENVLVNLARLTNGVLANYVKYGDFFRRVEQHEDVYYQLTYAPSSSKKGAPVKITLNNKKLSLVYDNQRQPRYIRDVVDKEQAVPQVTIREVAVSGKSASVTAAGFSREDLQRKEPLVEQTDGKEGTGKVDLRWRVLDNDGKEVFDQTRQFLPEAEKMNETLALPDLQPGTYDLIVEALDRNTGRNDLTIRSVTVDGAGEYQAVESAKGTGGTGGESGCLARTGREREECFKQLADSYLAWGDIVAAEKSYEQSGGENRAVGLNRIGDSFYDKAENETALLYYAKSSPTINRVRASMALADRYNRKGKRVLALFYYRNAVADFEALVQSGNAFLDDYDRQENERCRREIEKLERKSEAGLMKEGPG